MRFSGSPWEPKSLIRLRFEKSIQPALGPIRKSENYRYVKIGQVSAMRCWISTLGNLECLVRGNFEFNVPALFDVWPLGENEVVCFDFLD